NIILRVMNRIIISTLNSTMTFSALAAVLALFVVTGHQQAFAYGYPYGGGNGGYPYGGGNGGYPYGGGNGDPPYDFGSSPSDFCSYADYKSNVYCSDF
ncbi:MAG: hypothetical protein WB988_12025, partial [Candidatus Nitrosopolaris sp.]